MELSSCNSLNCKKCHYSNKYSLDKRSLDLGKKKVIISDNWLRRNKTGVNILKLFPFSGRSNNCSTKIYLKTPPLNRFKCTEFLFLAQHLQSNQYWLFNSKDLFSNSPYCLPYSPCDVSLENLVLDQLSIP